MLFPGCSPSGLLSRISRPSCRVRGGLSNTSSYAVTLGRCRWQYAVCSHIPLLVVDQTGIMQVIPGGGAYASRKEAQIFHQC
jgi:hypothetical protein